jgi:hypothetical protein
MSARRRLPRLPHRAPRKSLPAFAGQNVVCADHRSAWRAAKLQRPSQPRDDFVLHVEEIGQGLVEPLGPEMIARFGVDELHVDTHATSAALDAALQHIAHIQLAPDRLHIERLAFVGEGRIAGDHDGPSYP